MISRNLAANINKSKKVTEGKKVNDMNGKEPKLKLRRVQSICTNVVERMKNLTWFFFRFSSFLSLAFHFKFKTGNVYFRNWFDYVCNTFDFCMCGHSHAETEKKDIQIVVYHVKLN